MVEMRKLTKMLVKKGFDNVEITKHKGKYHVLHICKNNAPVPLFITDDKIELLDYLNLHYTLGIRLGNVGNMKNKIRLVGKIFSFTLPERESKKNACNLLKDDEQFSKKVLEIDGVRSVDGPDVTGSFAIETDDCVIDADVINKLDQIITEIGFEDDEKVVDKR